MSNEYNEEMTAEERKRKYARDRYRIANGIPLDKEVTRGGAHNVKYSSKEEAHQAKLEYDREWYKSHRDSMRLEQKEWRLTHPEKMEEYNEKAKQKYRLAHNISLDIEDGRKRRDDSCYITCQCGKTYSFTNKTKHDKTKFHTEFLKTNSILREEVTTELTNKKKKKKRAFEFIIEDEEIGEEIIIKWW